MAVVHLMVGFIGFGKTTIAKEIEKKFLAIRFTHDDIMLERYGRNPDDFQTKFNIVDDYIRNEAQKYIKIGKDVILDYGFWSHDKRDKYYKWAKGLTKDVVFHVVLCDIKEAKRRVLSRTENDDKALLIDENIFDILLKQYEPWGKLDDYPVVFHNVENKK